MLLCSSATYHLTGYLPDEQYFLPKSGTIALWIKPSEVTCCQLVGTHTLRAKDYPLSRDSTGYCRTAMCAIANLPLFSDVIGVWLIYLFLHLFLFMFLFECASMKMNHLKDEQWNTVETSVINNKTKLLLRAPLIECKLPGHPVLSQRTLDWLSLPAQLMITIRTNLPGNCAHWTGVYCADNASRQCTLNATIGVPALKWPPFLGKQPCGDVLFATYLPLVPLSIVTLCIHLPLLISTVRHINH